MAIRTSIMLSHPLTRTPLLWLLQTLAMLLSLLSLPHYEVKGYKREFYSATLFTFETEENCTDVAFPPLSWIAVGGFDFSDPNKATHKTWYASELLKCATSLLKAKY